MMEFGGFEFVALARNAQLRQDGQYGICVVWGGVLLQYQLTLTWHLQKATDCLYRPHKGRLIDDDFFQKIASPLATPSNELFLFVTQILARYRLKHK
ncbi:MAG: hypothetical protein V4772_22750 [Pseudomonadota bacterium]